MNQPTNPTSFDARFVIHADFTTIHVESETNYLARFKVAVPDESRVDLVRIATNGDVIYMEPSEALQVAAALQAVAVDLMETKPLVRRTDAGQPAFEEGI